MKEKLKIFLTGGNGFIGKNILEQIGDKYVFFTPSKAELDLNDTDRVAEYIAQNRPDVLVHAANVGGSRKQNELSEVAFANLKIFYNLVRNHDRFDRMIMFGSGAEYDKRFDIIDVHETDFDRRVPADQYGFYKYVCAKYAETVGYITHLRIFGIFGKYEDYATRFISNNICRSLYGLPISINKNVYFDYLYVHDFVNVVDGFIKNPGREKFYNAASGKKIDLVSLAEIIRSVTNSRSEIIVKTNGLNKEYTCNSDRLKNEFPNHVLTDIRQAVSELADYYKSNLHNINKQELLFD